jgi:DNA polymerase-3 subunit epsilon
VVADAPTFPEIYPTDAALKDKRVLIYNSAFDIKILNYCCRLHSLPVLKLAKRSDCLMEWVAQWVGNGSYYHKDYRYVPLNGGHLALTDCTVAFELIKLMAAGSDRINCPVPIPQSKRKSKTQ